MKRLAILVAVFLGMGIITAHSAEPPLPADLSIVPPDSSLPQQLKALSGKWGGTRRFNLPRQQTMEEIIVFEKITAEKAQFVWAHAGMVAPGRNFPPSYKRYRVNLKIEGNNVNFRIESINGRGEFQFITSEDIIKYQGHGSRQGGSYATFKRLPPQNE
jgi:hypothetical protein